MRSIAWDRTRGEHSRRCAGTEKGAYPCVRADSGEELLAGFLNDQAHCGKELFAALWLAVLCEELLHLRVRALQEGGFIGGAVQPTRSRWKLNAIAEVAQGVLCR